MKFLSFAALAAVAASGQVLPGPMCSTLKGPFCYVEYWSSNSSCHGCGSCNNCNSCTLCATPPDVWTADFAAVKGPALKRGNGVLISVTPDGPPEEILNGWAPSMYRGAILPSGINESDPNYGRFLFANYPRLKTAGVRDFQLLVSNAWPHDLGKASEPYPCDGGNCTEWVALLATLAGMIEGKYTNVTFDVWNEPDGGTFWRRSWDQYLTAYSAAVPVIRKLAPSARISGPSLYHGDVAKLCAFLAHMAPLGALPDVVTWHELSSPNGRAIDYTVTEARKCMAQYDKYQASSIISINEVVPAPSTDPTREGLPTSSPAVVLSYMAAAERTEVESMAHACWADLGCQSAGGDCWSDSMDGMVCAPLPHTTDAWTLRSTYHMYVAYAELAGKVVAPQPLQPSAIDGIAALDDGNRIARVLLGAPAPGQILGNLTVRLASLPPSWGTQMRLEVDVLRWSGYNQSEGFINVHNAKVEAVGGVVEWVLPNCQRNSCLMDAHGVLKVSVWPDN